MGIYFEKLEDEKIYSDALMEVESVMKAAKPKFGPGEKERNQRHPIHITHGERLFKKLQKTYSQYKFTYLDGHEIIECKEFGQYFYLILEPKGSYYRIDFRIRGYDNNQYRLLEKHRCEVESKFPSGVVVWGPQMKRVKLDFPTPNPDLSNQHEDVLLQWVQIGKNHLENILDNRLEKKRQ
ncbi:MAG: hypothetical protein EOO46_01860 [Flavobacterium sp.]|nr:MAG: hypothetical protein EOO46_01860 [Flavobacterium sp.]